MRTIAFLLLGLLSTVSSVASAQELSDRGVRVGANLALGLAGDLDYQVNNTRTGSNLDPSVGFDFRAEVPVLDFLVVGGMFEFLSVLADTRGAEREETFAFDAFLRARWVFEVVDRTLFIEPYVMLPLGFTMAVVPGGSDDIWPGWNTGVFAGAQVLHESGFGGYLEIGWRHAEAYTEQFLGFSADVSLIMNEMALNIGAVYAFGD